MTIEDGRNAKQPYRVRVGGVWYWVDPTVPAAELEPGDTVVIYPADGGATFAVLRSGVATDKPVSFASLDGEGFELEPGEIAALHLAAVDDDQAAPR
jgi:hypothetical protein